MTVLTNAFQNVALYRDSGLAYLINKFPMIHKFNKKFKDFDRLDGNLGNTVTYDLPPRFLAQEGLIVGGTNDAVQRVRSLVTDKSQHVAFDFSAEQYIFNAEDYMDKFGRGAMVGLGTKIESDIETLAVTNTYKFFDFRGAGDLSYRNLAQANVKFRTQGSTNGPLEVYLPDVVQPSIIDNGLGQFVTTRNNEIAMSWELGFMNDANYNSCNLLPTHISGESSDSNSADVFLTTGLNVDGDQLHLINGTDNPFAIRKDDILVFNKSSGLRFLTENGGGVSANEVSVRATADAAVVGGEVIVDIYPSLVSITVDPLNAESNINQPVGASDSITVIGDHRAGMIIADNAGFLAMNRLPDTAPFPSHTKPDLDSGANIRMYYGAFLGENRYMTVYDSLYGFDVDPQRTMRLIFPV